MGSRHLVSTAEKPDFRPGAGASCAMAERLRSLFVRSRLAIPFNGAPSRPPGGAIYWNKGLGLIDGRARIAMAHWGNSLP